MISDSATIVIAVGLCSAVSAGLIATALPDHSEKAAVTSGTGETAAMLDWSPSHRGCDRVFNLRSVNRGQRVNLTFKNQSGGQAKLYFITYKGRAALQQTIDDGAVYVRNTIRGHSWIVTDANDTCLDAVTTGEPMTLTIEPADGTGPSIASILEQQGAVRMTAVNAPASQAGLDRDQHSAHINRHRRQDQASAGAEGGSSDISDSSASYWLGVERRRHHEEEAKRAEHRHEAALQPAPSHDTQTAPHDHHSHRALVKHHTAPPPATAVIHK